MRPDAISCGARNPTRRALQVGPVAISWLVGFNTLLGRSLDPGSGIVGRQIRGMNATLMYVGVGAVLATGVAILTIAVLFLQTARRYVDLTERRLELLQEGEAFLLKLVQRQGHALEVSRERSEKLPEMLGNTRGRRQGE